jgi:hypothetical protein
MTFLIDDSVIFPVIVYFFIMGSACLAVLIGAGVNHNVGREKKDTASESSANDKTKASYLFSRRK